VIVPQFFRGLIKLIMTVNRFVLTLIPLYIKEGWGIIHYIKFYYISHSKINFKI
jgi:hypothetical protein